MLLMVLMEELSLKPRHVDVGGTLALTGLAFKAKVENIAHGGIGESFEIRADR